MRDVRQKAVNKWFMFPDMLENTGFRFGGYFTRDDITQMRGFFPVGQNIKFTDSNTPTVRNGFEMVGAEISGVYPVKRAWRFELRDGTEIEMKTYADKVLYRIDGLMDDFSVLKEGFTSGLEFCFAIIAKSSEIPSGILFCNGVEDWQKWTGEHTTYVSDDGSNIITVADKLSEPAKLKSGRIFEGSYSKFSAITNGSFRITINGSDYNIDGINFTTGGGVSSMADVASKIQAAIRTATSGTETVSYDSAELALTITTNDGSSSAITVATTSTGTIGTDISGTVAGNTYLRLTALNVASVYDRQVYKFATSGNIMINSETINYTGVNGYTFTGCSAVPTTPTVGDIIVNEPVNANLTDFKSSVGMAHDGRIHARLETKKSVSNYSKLDDPTDWTTGATDGDGGGKELEQGGPITAYGRDESLLYIFKKRMIKTLQYVANTDRIDVPKYGTLKPGDDKSTTVGAIGQKSTFHSPNGVLFVTEDKELLHLTRAENIDYPQLISISDPIRPTFQEGNHDEASGIVYDSKVWYAYKQDNNSSYNDTVIVYDLIKQVWYPPIVGWNVSDWTVINNELHWHSSTTPNTYKMISDKTDNSLGFSTTLRSWAETFGEPHLQKKAGYCYLEIYMPENAEITATILYDEDGYSGQEEYALRANSDIGNKFNSEEYNPFGANAFGYEKFGSNANISGLKKYRYLLELKKNIEFFNISLQLSSDKAGMNYEMVRFGWYLEDLLSMPAYKYLKSTT